MSDFEMMCRMLKRFPSKDEDGTQYKIHTYGKQANYLKCIVLCTDDDYCNAFLYFDKDGKFIGFHDE